jgi:hypothetical protein
MNQWVCATGRITLVGPNRNTSRETCPSVSLSTTNCMWIAVWVNTCLNERKPLTNHLNWTTARHHTPKSYKTSEGRKEHSYGLSADEKKIIQCIFGKWVPNLLLHYLNIWNRVATGFRRNQFENNHVNTEHSRRKNSAGFVILVAIVTNVTHSVKISTRVYYNFGKPTLHYLFTKRHQSNQTPNSIHCKLSF